MSDPNNQSTPKNPVGRFMFAVGSITEYQPEGLILIIKRSNSLDWKPGAWEIGYGRIAQGESPEEGLRREVFEELGISDIEIVQIISTWHLFRGSEKPDNELIGITFHSTTRTKQIKLSEEHSEYAWVTPENALRRVSDPGVVRDIQLFIDSRRRKVTGSE